MIGDPEFEVIEFGSSLMKRTLYRLDSDILSLENAVKFLEIKNKELEKKISNQLSESLNSQHANMAATLTAALGVPAFSTMGTVGATVLVKIRQMNTIDEIHNYIDDMINKEENINIK